jgi:YfiH family protein
LNVKRVKPDWPAPPNVHAFTTTRAGGYSKGAFSSLNLGVHCGDDPLTVSKNRDELISQLPVEPPWLKQVHGKRVISYFRAANEEAEADGLVSSSPGQVCAVLTADCLPVLFCNRAGSQVAAAHAGWRGLAQGVIQSTISRMNEAPEEIITWLGPAIGPKNYEVGDAVRNAFPREQAKYFTKTGDRWLLDLYGVARHLLSQLGITGIYGGQFCTFSDSERFFSYRRNGTCGRMATVIWLEPQKGQSPLHCQPVAPPS